MLFGHSEDKWSICEGRFQQEILCDVAGFLFYDEILGILDASPRRSDIVLLHRRYFSDNERDHCYDYSFFSLFFFSSLNSYLLLYNLSLYLHLVPFLFSSLLWSDHRNIFNWIVHWNRLRDGKDEWPSSLAGPFSLVTYRYDQEQCRPLNRQIDRDVYEEGFRRSSIKKSWIEFVETLCGFGDEKSIVWCDERCRITSLSR